MRRHSPQYYSPPRRGYNSRGRSPPRRGGGGYGRHKDQPNGSLLVRNIPMDCRPEELRVPFERFGVVRDVYLPKDYYTGEPRGFAFVQFVDGYDASEAQYHMNGQIFAGREISVVVAAETRKRPEEMRKRTRSSSHRGPSGYGGRRSSHYGRSRSRSVSRSRSPRRPSSYRSRHRSRSYSPAPKRRGDYSVSPGPRRRGDFSISPGPRRRDDYSASPDGRPAEPVRSPRDAPQRREADRRRSYSPGYGDPAGFENRTGNGAESRSPSGSRSRSADISPRRS